MFIFLEKMELSFFETMDYILQDVVFIFLLNRWFFN